MPRLDKVIEVEAPMAKVFEFLGHVERWPRWQPGEVRAARVGETRGAGTVVRRESVACGTRLAWDAVVDEWIPGRRLAWHQVSGDWADHRGAWDLEPAGPRATRTRVRLRVELELPHVLDAEITAEAAEHELSRSLDEALLNLKDEMES